MTNIFCFILKAFFVLKMFKFMCSLFVHAEKQLDLKGKVDFKIYNITAWLANNYNTHIA